MILKSGVFTLGVMILMSGLFGCDDDKSVVYQRVLSPDKKLEAVEHMIMVGAWGSNLSQVSVLPPGAPPGMDGNVLGLRNYYKLELRWVDAHTLEIVLPADAADEMFIKMVLVEGVRVNYMVAANEAKP